MRLVCFLANNSSVRLASTHTGGEHPQGLRVTLWLGANGADRFQRLVSEITLVAHVAMMFWNSLNQHFAVKLREKFGVQAYSAT